MADNKYKTYGLYNANFVRVPAPGTTVKQESWMGKLPSNASKGKTDKFKK